MKFRWIFWVGGIVVMGFIGLAVLRTCIASREIARIPSPDGRWDVVVVAYSAGAGSRSMDQIFLTPKGNPAESGSKVLKARRTGERSIRWLNPSMVEVWFKGHNVQVNDFDSEIDVGKSGSIRFLLRTGSDPKG